VPGSRHAALRDDHSIRRGAAGRAA
jgi:hypothetical protein